LILTFGSCGRGFEHVLNSTTIGITNDNQPITFNYSAKMLYTQQNDISEREFNSILTRTKFELRLFDQLQPIVAEYTYHQLEDLDFREISDKL
jgi:hypothetical protein